MKHIFFFFALFVTPLFAGLTRHNEQGLSPTHSYKGTGPQESISNLNGNLVIQSLAADITSSPLGIRVERSFNSHWRDPWTVFQYDLDYDKADQRKKRDGKEDWDIEYKNIDPDDSWRGSLEYAGGVLRRESYKVSNGDAVPRGYLWAASTMYSLANATDHLYDLSHLDFSQLGSKSSPPSTPPAGSTTVEGSNWGGVAFTVASMGLQIWGIVEKSESGNLTQTDEAMFAASMAVSAVSLAALVADGSSKAALQKVAAPLGLALSIWGAKEFFENSHAWDPGYEAQSFAAIMGVYLSAIGTVLAFTPEMGPYGVVVLAVAVVIAVTAAVITYIDAANNEWDMADFQVNPWSLGVNGYVVLMGTKYREELSDPSRRFGGYCSTAIRTSTLKSPGPKGTKIGESYCIGTNPGSNHPMAEAQLVRADGGADKFVLSSADYVERDGVRWYSYQSLSRLNRTKILYADSKPYETERIHSNGIRQVVSSDPNDFYLVKESDGTWARFGVGNTKGVERQQTEWGDPFETYWALPNSVHTFGAEGSLSGDSISIERDASLQVTKVTHSRDPRSVEITRSGNQETVSEKNDGTVIRSTRYTMGKHEFVANSPTTKTTVNMNYGLLLTADIDKPIPGRRMSIPVVLAVEQDIDPGVVNTTKFKYSNGNLERVDNNDGSYSEYSFDPAEKRGPLDGFCLSKTHWSGAKKSAKKQWVYSYSGWGNESGAGNTDEGSSPYLTTQVKTSLSFPDETGSSPLYVSEKSDLYRFVVARDGVNVRHNPGVFYSNSLSDTSITRLMEYQTSRMQLSTQILGSEGPGERTDFMYDGDLLSQKVHRMGRDLSVHPTITQYVYDRLGNVVLEQTNTQSQLLKMEQSLLLSFSDEFKAGTMDTNATWDALRPGLVSNYEAKTGKKYVSSMDVLDRTKVNAYLNEDTTEFWARYGVWSANPKRARDSIGNLDKVFFRKLERGNNLSNILAQALSNRERSSALSTTQWDSVVTFRQALHFVDLQTITKDSIQAVKAWRALPESVTIWYDSLRRSTFQPYGRYVVGLPLGSLETRKHPDTAAFESGVYGTRMVYDHKWLRPVQELALENGRTRTLKRWQYDATAHNPYAPTRVKNYFGPVGSDSSKVAYRYEEMDLESRYWMQPSKVRVWSTLQYEDTGAGDVWSTPSGTPLLTQRTYDERMRLLSETSPRGTTTTTTYDLADRPRTTTFPDGTMRRSGYTDVQDADGWIWQHDTLESGVVQSYGFDGLGRLGRSLRRSADNKTLTQAKLLYGVHDKLLREVDADGRVVDRSYDSYGRLTQVLMQKPGLGDFERNYAWDDRAQTLTEMDANGKVTTFWYNLYGQDTCIERKIDDTSRYVAKYRYDNFGNPVWVKSPDGDTTTHSYDWGNRVRRSQYPEGIEVRRSFDWQGLPRRVVQTGKTWKAGISGTAESEITTLSYDALGRSDSVEVVGDPRMGVRYLYDTDGDTNDPGMLLTVRRASGSQGRYRYDSRGSLVRRIALQNAFGTQHADTIGFQLRASQQREVTRLPRGGRIEYGYDGLDRVGKVSFVDPKGTRHIIADTILYRASDLVDSVKWGNGTSTKYGYDSGRPLLTAQMLRGKKGQILSSMELVHDGEGNIVEQTRPGGERALFDLDGLYRLTAVRYPSGDLTARGNLRYAYTKNGNRLSFGHEYGSEKWAYVPGTNLLQTASLSQGAVRYDWDARGNLARETRWSVQPTSIVQPTDASLLEDRRLSWNQRNELERLERVRRMPGNGALDTSRFGYGYDENGWRSAKASGQVLNSDTAWKVGERTLWDGVNAVADSGVSDTGWSYQVHLGLKRVAEVRKDSLDAWKVLWVETDHLGTVQALVDDTGAVRARYQLDPYGNLETYEGDKTTAYLYTGKPRDGETGWDYFGARYYDPVRGGWTGRDPAEQMFSPYIAPDNPLISIDLDGMVETPIQGAKFNSGYGMRWHPVKHTLKMHKGQDLKAASGTPVHSLAAGVVVTVATGKKGYGTIVVIDHGDGEYSMYAHLKSVSVKAGEKVSEGETVALSGNTGVGTGPHLHYEVWKDAGKNKKYGDLMGKGRIDPKGVNLGKMTWDELNSQQRGNTVGPVKDAWYLRLYNYVKSKVN